MVYFRSCNKGLGRPSLIFETTDKRKVEGVAADGAILYIEFGVGALRSRRVFSQGAK
jgi:hypothetical protein